MRVCRRSWRSSGSRTSGASCFYPAGFVEPVPHVWARLEKMCVQGAELLEKTPFPDGRFTRKDKYRNEVQIDFKTRQKEQAAFLRNFAQQVGILKTIAAKQLDQKELTREETTFLEDVVQIRRGSTANRFGLAAGDIIAAVNGQPVASVDDLQSALAAADRWEISFRRDGVTRTLKIE